MNKKFKNLKICFIALGAYQLLKGERCEYVSGPDVHQLLLARELIQYGIKVTFLSYCDIGPRIEMINGIEVIKIKKCNSSSSLLNLLLRTFWVWKAMHDSNSDIYFHHGSAAGLGSLFCRAFRRKYVYHVASDAIVDRSLISCNIKEFNRSFISTNVFPYWLDIKLADAIIVQNSYQKDKLRATFGKKSILIKMPIEIDSNEYKKQYPPIIIWVGTISEVKNPKLFLELAKQVPDAFFQMIGGCSDINKSLYAMICENASNIPNMEFLGVVPHQEVGRYFGKASLLVNTSMFEGFPNAFLQAWMYGVPVISLNADPDQLLSVSKLGRHSRSFPQLARDVNELLLNEELRAEIGNRAKLYIREKHDIKKIIKIYINLFWGLWGDQSPSSNWCDANERKN